MLRFECNRKKPKIKVFDILDDNPGSPKSLEQYNRFIERDDIEIIGQPQTNYQPPPMFSDEQGETRAKMYYIVSYREKGKRDAKRV